MNIRLLFLALGIALSVSACIPVIATGVGVGVAATLDRRSYGNQVEDGTIESRLNNRISEKLGASARIAVTSYNRIVLLSGEAPSEAAKQDAEQLVAGIPNEIRGVHNEIVVGPKANLSRQSEDTFITSKVKTRLLESRSVSGNQVKVVTESGTVFLMGMLTAAEADAAAYLASTTTGVRKVVRLVEIVTPEQAHALDNPAGSPAKSSPNASQR